MHNVLFILSYAHVAGCFNKCRNKQSTVFIQSNLLIMSNFTRWYAKTDIIDHAIFCRIHDVRNMYAHYRLRQYLYMPSRYRLESSAYL